MDDDAVRFEAIMKILSTSAIEKAAFRENETTVVSCGNHLTKPIRTYVVAEKFFSRQALSINNLSNKWRAG